MVLQSSGAITLADIRTEFGGAAPDSLSEYYAGGTYVPAGTVGYPGGVSTPIPSSGTISFSNFYGATKISTVIRLDTAFYDSMTLNVTTVGVRVGANGTFYSRTQGVYNAEYQWCTPTTDAANYEIYASSAELTSTGDALDTWLSLSTTRSWVIVDGQDDGEAVTDTLTLSIRRIGTTSPVTTATISLYAFRDGSGGVVMTL